MLERKPAPPPCPDRTASRPPVARDAIQGVSFTCTARSDFNVQLENGCSFPTDFPLGLGGGGRSGSRTPLEARVEFG